MLPESQPVADAASLHLAVRAANVGLWDWDLRTNRVSYSAEWKRQIGWEEHEISDSFDEWRSRLHPDDLDRALRTVEAYLARPQGALRNEFRFRHKDGSYRWIVAHGTMLTDAAGQPTRLLGAHLDVSDHKLAARKLQQEDLNYRAIFEEAVVGIFQTTPDGRFLAVNPALARLLGFASPEELLAQRTDIARQGYVRPEDREEFKRRLDEHGVVNGFEYETPRKDGSLVWVSESARAVRDGRGRILFYEGTMRDITAQRAADQRLRASEQRFQNLFEASPDAIIVATRAGIIQEVNRQGEQLFGYARGELIGQPVEVLMPGRFNAAHADQREQYVSSPHLRQMGEGRDLFARRKDGTEFPVDISLSPITTPDGVLIISTIRDITARKRSEAALNESRQMLEKAQQIGRIGSFTTNFTTDGRLVWSKETCRIFGVASEDFDGRVETYNSLVHREDRELVRRVACAALAGERLHDLEYRIVRRDGQIRWVHEQADVERDEEGRPVRCVGVVQDITERKQLEEQLRQSQKMEAVGQLAGGIAHDFNNILAAIIGNVEVAKSVAPTDPELPSILEATLAAGLRARDLVRQILAFSRRQGSQRNPMQLHFVVKEAIKLLRSIVPTTVEFQLRIADTPTVLANPSEIHQVTMNLCTNAWHAMPGGHGMLKVDLEEVPVTQELARQQPDLRPGRYVRLTVADNGCGMDAATLQRIFEPFFTTKAPGSGTGLGLAVVHGIIKSHDGGIIVESELDVGSRFQVFLPVFEEDRAIQTDEPKRAIPGHGERILLVDDEEPIVKMGKHMLERLGYRVTAVTEPAEAQGLFATRPDKFDLVITDLHMPRLDGFELVRGLLAIRSDIPIVLSTGFSATLTEETLRSSGVRELLPKPYDRFTLAEIVNRALKGSGAAKHQPGV